MEVTWRSRSGRLLVKTTNADGFLGAVQFAGACAEAFDNDKCGACGSQNVAMRVRESGEYKFPEVKCLDCGHELHLGQRKNAAKTLWAKMKDEDGNWLPNNGWVKPYNPSDPQSSPRGGSGGGAAGGGSEDDIPF